MVKLLTQNKKTRKSVDDEARIRSADDLFLVAWNVNNWKDSYSACSQRNRTPEDTPEYLTI